MRLLQTASWPSASVLLVLTGGWIDYEKSTSARRLALPLGNLDPKETPEVIALGCAFLQQTVDAPVDGHWRAAVPSPRTCCRFRHGQLGGQERAWCAWKERQ